MIGKSAFTLCNGLTEAILPEGVASIGEGAFQSCSKLALVTIPASVASIGEDAFVDCPSLETISVAPGNPAYRDIDGVLFTKDQSTLILFPRKKSGSYAVPSGTVRLGKKSFRKCWRLTLVTIPGGVVDIGEEAFYGCTGLTEMTIPDSVATIGKRAFRYCPKLPSIAIPAGVSSIASEAFRFCEKLTSATFAGDAPVLGENVFDGVAPDFIIYYSNSASGFTHPLWHGYPTSVIGTD
jgi:hypothetical protein